MRMRSHTAGLTLVEALLSIVIVGLMAGVIATLYASGLQSIDVSAERTLLDSAHRSKMEELLGQEFASITGGSDTVSVNGKNFGITWAVVTVDLDGDTNPEADAKQVTVTLDGRDLTALAVDNPDEMGKL
jgi:Tfp pilus assembly protein PilE